MLATPGLFRLSLASLVVVNHFTRIAVGTAAVDLFFILSGYWIYKMYARKYSRGNRPVMTFLASRLLRLLPIFLIFNLMAILAYSIVGTYPGLKPIATDILPNFLILGYASLPFRPLGPAWSLDIELQFYLLFPLLWMLMPLTRNRLALIVGALVLAGVLYVGVYVKDTSAIVLPYLGFFGIGILAAWTNWAPPRLHLLLAIIGTGLMTAVIVSLPQLRGILIVGPDDPMMVWNPMVNAVAAVLLAPLAIFSVKQKSSSTDRLMGDLSYVVYCSHWVAVIVIARYFADAPFMRKLPFVVLAILLVYAVSFLALLFIDRPIGRLRELWVERQLTA